MTEPVPFAQRLRKGLVRIDAEAAGPWEGESLAMLRRSLQMTIVRLESKTNSPLARFRFQFTGGKALLFQNNEALPLEPEKLFRLLNAMEIQLQPGETVDLDGGLAAWIIRPEVTLVDTTLRQAEETLRELKANRDRDHGATQAADSARIRLRSRMTQLVAALQVAQKEPDGNAPPVVPLEVVAEVPPPPPPPKPKRETAIMTAAPPPPPSPAPAPGPAGPPTEALAIALRRIIAAINGCGFKSAAIGDVGFATWGSKRPVTRIELLIAIGQTQRETLLSAARGEGLFTASGGGPLNVRYVDSKSGVTADIDVMEVSTPFHREIITRAKSDFVLGTEVRAASCEDLIVLRAASEDPRHRDSVIELLRLCINRIDGSYLKRAAQTLGVMDQLKVAWQEAKKDAP